MYRGDRIIVDSDLLIFEETATTPTASIALKTAIWYACLENHTATCSDAVQAFLQSELDKNDFTYVILPTELWLNEWHEKQKGMRLCVRLRRSVYGHPMAGKWWHSHLEQHLVELGAVEVPAIQFHLTLESFKAWWRNQ